jgi:hypothetical protein
VAFLGEVNVGYQVADRFALFVGTGAQVVLSPSGEGFSLFGIPLGPSMALAPMLVFGVQL